MFTGPDGGDGGNGGHVVITASRNVTSLSHIPRVVKADAGVNGKNKCMHGKNANHTVYKVGFTCFLGYWSILCLHLYAYQF